MTNKQHRYAIRVVWTGNRGTGTATHRGYERAHLIEVAGKPPIIGSSDSVFRGDPSRWNPEELLVASLSACHKLWYLGLCAEAGVVVLSYEDDAEGLMVEEASGAGQFVSVALRPRGTIAAELRCGTSARPSPPGPRDVLHRAVGQISGSRRNRPSCGKRLPYVPDLRKIADERGARNRRARRRFRLDR